MSRRPAVVSLLAIVLLSCLVVAVAAAPGPAIQLTTQVLNTTCDSSSQYSQILGGLNVTPRYGWVQSEPLRAESTEKTTSGDSFWLSAYVFRSATSQGDTECGEEMASLDVELKVGICSVSRPEWAVGSVLVVEILSVHERWDKKSGCANPHYFSDSRNLPLQFTTPEGTSGYVDTLFGSWYSVTGWEGSFLFPDSAGYLCGGAWETATPERSVRNQRAILFLNSGAQSEGGFLGAFTLRLGFGVCESTYRVTLRLPRLEMLPAS